MAVDEKYDILIDGLKNGDREIFDRIFRIHYSGLVNYCVKYINDDDVAEEIVQNIFVSLWEKREELTISSSLKSYLYRAVRNDTINYIKTAKTHDKHIQYLSENQNEVVNPQDTYQGNDFRLHFEDALLSLPEKCREIFELRRFDGLKSKDIAQKMNISVKTVEKQISKAIALLKNKLQEYLTMFLF